MSEYHICAECTDFIGGGDWGLCCKSMEYTDLCYEYTKACERFKPGRHIDPYVFYVDTDGRLHALHSDEATLSDYIDKAKELIRDGYTNVRVVDGDSNRVCPVLWMECV